MEVWMSGKGTTDYPVNWEGLYTLLEDGKHSTAAVQFRTAVSRCQFSWLTSMYDLCLPQSRHFNLIASLCIHYLTVYIAYYWHHTILPVLWTYGQQQQFTHCTDMFTAHTVHRPQYPLKCRMSCIMCWTSPLHLVAHGRYQTRPYRNSSRSYYRTACIHTNTQKLFTLLHTPLHSTP